MFRFPHKSICAISLGFAFLTSSCSMMEEKIDECPTGLFVRYVYDYNIQRADMFKDHVGHITLFVYDENGLKVAERSVSNSPAQRPLASYGYTTHFDPSELAPGRYRLQAVAMQTDWNDALSSDRAHYQRTSDHSMASDFLINLEHSGQPNPLHGRHDVVHSGLPLDTLWHTLKVMSSEPAIARAIPDLHQTMAPYSVYPVADQYVTVRAGHATYATVSLIRDTKHLNITLRQIDDPAQLSHDDYEVTLDDDNSLLAHDNSIIPNHPLRYTPFALWTTRLTSSGLEYESGNIDEPSRSGIRYAAEADGEDESDPTLRRTAHYNIMFNRLMFDNDDSKCAKLRIRNKKTGKEVGTFNLPLILAEGRTAYQSQNYSRQEYLDREHDYQLDFLLKGDRWESVTVRIDILSWSRRIQNADLQ